MRFARLTMGVFTLLLGSVSLLAQDLQNTPPTTEYYPSKNKTKWVYKSNDQTIDVEIANVEKDGLKLDVKVGNKSVSSEVIEIKLDGVYRSSVKGDKIEPPVKILALPVKKDSKWSVNSKVGTQTVKGDFTIKSDNEPVTVPAGKFDTVLVDGPDFDIAGTKAAVRYYFAKNVGPVKITYEIQGTPVVLELQQFVEGK